MKKVLLLACLALTAVGCNDFERNAFNTLASSKAVIDQSQTDYEARTIPHNACSYALINDAKAAQTVAVNAMIVYEQEKTAKSDLTAQTQVITQDLLSLAPLVAKVKSLASNPTACGGAQ